MPKDFIKINVLLIIAFILMAILLLGLAWGALMLTAWIKVL